MSLRFARGCVASPHRTATETGARVLREGGNAVDAAVATSIMLGVVGPYFCGFGGDLFAIVWSDGAHGFLGSGRAGSGVSASELRAAGHARVPERGPVPVTVPGAVDGWFRVLDRFGTRSFADLAAPALQLARDGFPASPAFARAVEASRAQAQAEWRRTYDGVRAGDLLMQADLARTIETLCSDGPDAYYRGEIASAIASVSTLAPEDLDEHAGEWVEPLRAPFAGHEILELPPPTQGVTALEMLRIAETIGFDGPDRDHLLIECAKIALGDRDRFLADPGSMTIDPASLFSGEHAARAAALVDAARARPIAPTRAPDGGTAYLCAADGEGMLVSMIQSNFMGFGSLVTVPGWGINLNNRGACFVLDEGHPNEIAPGKRPLHTLIPGLALRDGRPSLVFGSMGGHGQAQFHLQLLVRVLVDGQDIQDAIDAPRWLVSPADGAVVAEERFGSGWFDDMSARGLRVRARPDLSDGFGHAHAVVVEQAGYSGASDPRAEGAVLGP